MWPLQITFPSLFPHYVFAFKVSVTTVTWSTQSIFNNRLKIEIACCQWIKFPWLFCEIQGLLDVDIFWLLWRHFWEYTKCVRNRVDLLPLNILCLYHYLTNSTGLFETQYLYWALQHFFFSHKIEKRIYLNNMNLCQQEYLLIAYGLF